MLVTYLSYLKLNQMHVRGRHQNYLSTLRLNPVMTFEDVSYSNGTTKACWVRAFTPGYTPLQLGLNRVSLGYISLTTRGPLLQVCLPTKQC